MPKSPDLGINKTDSQILAELRKPQLGPMTAWAKVSITSGFQAANLDGSYYDGTAFEGTWDHADIDTWPVSWHQSHHGEVRLRGKAVGGAAGSIIFTLPAEDLPEFEQEFICSVDDAGNIDLSNVRFRAFEAGDV